ncbi:MULTISPECIES: hypothetical protein [unclassified Haloferax]|uniref:hypothetical protein n=1 Tax=unclassified Haloferax TaxID=2625095 RepID=UPI002876F71F|nr:MULTISPECIES: hypothetical protein [unclassified Haloferax]MDS0243959.1 hypothetical protein [Haloferax sp. S2CR25]MDS0447080.1 hypothetical protein [Haloferax sp. S2CR25-2]
MIIDPDDIDDQPGDPAVYVPGGGGSSNDDDDDNTVDTGDYLDNGGTGGYGSIDDDAGLDPGNSESGQPGGGDPANDVVSPDPNENTDGDEVTINPDGSASVDEDRLSGDYESVEDVADAVRDLVGSGSSTPEVGETTALQERLRDLREQLAGMGQVEDGDSSSGLLAMGAAGVAVVVAVGVALVAGGGDD